MSQPQSQAVLDDLVVAIRSGSIPAGSRLPTHRELARRHGIALETATRIYRRLGQMGLTVGEAGRGTFVRDQLGYDGLEPKRSLPVPMLADLSVNEPLEAAQVDSLRRALRDLAGSGNLESLLYQQPAGGRAQDRRIVATYLLSRGIDVAPDNVLITSGAQQGLDAALVATAEPGDLIAIDALSYPGVRMLAESRRHSFAAVPVAPSGPDLDALERICRERPVKVIYAEPTMHNPLSWVLSLAQRERMVAIARGSGALIIEDGTYAFLAPDAPPPLQALAPERTVYVASLSKNFATGLRFGFVVAPNELISRLRSGLRASTFGAPSIVTALGTGWLADGSVERAEVQRREDAEKRQALVRQYLDGYDYVTHPASLIVWLKLGVDQRRDLVASALAAQGILVTTAERYATNGNPPHALRIAIGTPPLDVLARALDILRTVLRSLG